MEKFPYQEPQQEEEPKREDRSSADNGKTELGYKKLSDLRYMLTALPTYEPVVKILDDLCDQAARLEPDLGKIGELQDRLRVYVDSRGLSDLYDAIETGHMTPEVSRKYTPGALRGE